MKKSRSLATRSRAKRVVVVGTAVLGLFMGRADALAQGTTSANGGSSNAAPAAAASSENSAGARGAKTYCFMRSEGNTHQVSWNAAYALIKRQSASLFKTSPEHAAVMITEAVVSNPSAYPDCGKYLGNLYVK